jgi:putative N6-adenine-specific DNA methylase
VPCAIGVEKALGNELRHQGFFIADSGPGRFEVPADWRETLTALRSLRCAERVLVVLADFKAFTFEDLFQGCRAVDWAAWLPRDARVHIDKVRIHDSALNSHASVQSVAQKAIYGRLGEQHRLERLPENGAEHQVRLYLEGNRARVCLDLAGEALHRRGWRTQAGEAPLKETIAAAMVVLSGWRRRHPFHDPFCGSGTLPAEALSFAYDLAPNQTRGFGLGSMNCYPAALDREVQAVLLSRVQTAHECLILASDRDPRMVETSRRNIRALLDRSGLDADARRLLEGRVRVEERRMEDLRRGEPGGWFLCNPPYGERLGDLEQARGVYRAMGRLFAEFPDWNLMAITTHPDYEREIGRRAQWRREVRNGASEARIFFHGGHLG